MFFIYKFFKKREERKMVLEMKKEKEMRGFLREFVHQKKERS
jgi:hypothetical protein